MIAMLGPVCGPLVQHPGCIKMQVDNKPWLEIVDRGDLVNGPQPSIESCLVLALLGVADAEQQKSPQSVKPAGEVIGVGMFDEPRAHRRCLGIVPTIEQALRVVMGIEGQRVQVDAQTNAKDGENN
jgi:hypothetical protein